MYFLHYHMGQLSNAFLHESPFFQTPVTVYLPPTSRTQTHATCSVRAISSLGRNFFRDQPYSQFIKVPNSGPAQSSLQTHCLCQSSHKQWQENNFWIILHLFQKASGLICRSHSINSQRTKPMDLLYISFLYLQLQNDLQYS